MRPGRVCEQIENGDLAIGRHQIGFGRQGRARRSEAGPEARGGFVTCTLMSLNAGMKRDTGSVSRTLALFHQHQDRRTRDRLRHRSDAEHRVLLHRPPRSGIHHASRLQVNDAAVASHQRHCARDVSRRHVAIDELVDALKSLGRQPDRFRLRRLRASRERAARARTRTEPPARLQTWTVLPFPT